MGKTLNSMVVALMLGLSCATSPFTKNHPLIQEGHELLEKINRKNLGNKIERLDKERKTYLAYEIKGAETWTSNYYDGSLIVYIDKESDGKVDEVACLITSETSPGGSVVSTVTDCNLQNQQEYIKTLRSIEEYSSSN